MGFGLILGSFLFFTAQTSGATFGMAKNIEIKADESLSSNAYRLGNIVSVSGEISEDLFVLSKRFDFSGQVSGDLSVASGEIRISPKSLVLGDVRVGGGSVELGGEIVGDLIVLGGRVVVLPGAKISGDVVLAGGSILVSESKINGTVHLLGGQIFFDGQVENGPVYAKSDFVSLGENAHFAESFEHIGRTKAEVISEKTFGGSYVFTQREGLSYETGILLGALDFLGWIGILLISLIIFSLFKDATENVLRVTTENLPKVFLVSLGIMILGPIFVFLLALTFFGLPLALIAAGILLTLVMFAYAGTGILFGYLITKKFFATKDFSWKSVVLGVTVLFFIRYIPWLGTFIFVLLFLFALGGISIYLGRLLKKTSV